jgi:hypothetical protein
MMIKNIPGDQRTMKNFNVNLHRKSGDAVRPRRGVALLVVLLIVMAVAILSMGFLTRSDVELACGRNMVLRTQTDYLAESALEHARGLILNPQDVDSEYWTGADNQQLVDGSGYFYDVNVLRLGRCDYLMTCEGYRESNGEKVGSSRLKAQLRLDPCIALWAENHTVVWPRMTVDGDVYCSGALTNSGIINGDAFVSTLNGTVTGKRKAIEDISLQWPQTTVADFTSRYAVQAIGSTLSGVTLGPYDPVRVCYHGIGDVELVGNVQVTGMLAVGGNLTIRAGANIVRAAKNLPALLVTGNLIIEDASAIHIEGLALVEGQVQVSAGVTDVNATGGLFTRGGIFETTADSSDNGNTGVVYNGPAWRPSGGQIDGALEFDGVDDYIRTPDDPTKLQLSADYTLAVWIKADPAQTDWAGIFARCDSTGSVTHWALQFDNLNPRKLVLQHPGSTWDTGIRLSDIAGAWHHVRIVRQAAVMFSYLDGNEVRSNNWNDNPGAGQGYLNIGIDQGNTYKGLIDDLRVYDTAPEVGQIYPAGVPIGHWKLDEQPGGTIEINAAPLKTAIVTWPAGSPENWAAAAGAFFRSIERN